LHKPGKLDEAERKVIETHPTIGADILAPLAFLQEAVPLVLFHHERWGGGGYPSGISGDTIPIGARVISVADSHNAMISDRPYRSGLTEEEAIAELRDNAGTQFDPIVVEAFLRVLAEENALT
jgi:HD-GYP domain-containing protein (c-di-GMP phosphodiesterase class II)